MERTYTIPLRRSFVQSPRYKRTPRAVKTVRLFLQKHMKADEVKLGQHLNTMLWKHGIRNPPGKLRVTAVKDDAGVVKAELEGMTYAEAAAPKEAQVEPQGLKEKLQAAIGKDEKSEEKKEDSPTTKPEEKK